mmetsp:Transcript_33106/g.65957  ORF Transcript_33106/g.65957 Transcript_33106/m.65957 type:complete len:249 (+) Transcript_33106:158-904(+)
MGGGASRVQALEDQEELQARLARASNNRHHLVLMNLNTGKLASHSANISKINSKLIKATDKLVDQKTKYTKQVTVKSKAVTLKQKEIDDLKHAERLVAECIATLDPLKKQLADLVVDYETGLQEMQDKRQGDASRTQAPTVSREDEIATAPLSVDASPPPSQPRVGGLTGDEAAPVARDSSSSARGTNAARAGGGSQVATDLIDEDISDFDGPQDASNEQKDFTIHIHTGGGRSGGVEPQVATAVPAY